MKFKLLLNMKQPKAMEFLGLNQQSQSLILLINDKMPTIVGILTLMSRINVKLNRVGHVKKIYNLEDGTFGHPITLLYTHTLKLKLRGPTTDFFLIQFNVPFKIISLIETPIDRWG